MSDTTRVTTPLSMVQVLLCGAAIVTLSMGIRHGFGLWLQPITMERGWTRETFAFALAVQNLVWGLAGPLAGGLADRFGACQRACRWRRCFYAAGLVLMALATSGLAFNGSAGLLLGIAQSGTTYAIVFGVIGRKVDADQALVGDGRRRCGRLVRPVPDDADRELADRRLGLAERTVRARRPRPGHGATRLRSAGSRATAAIGHGAHQSVGSALREAFAYPSFRLLMAGYFVCGFHVVFIGVHMPSYLKDKGLTPDVATTALALIGLFNVFGTYAAGVVGQRWPKR